MTEIVLYSLLAAALLALLFWLSRNLVRPPEPVRNSLERLLPQHLQYFPALRQSLQHEDEEFLRGRIARRELERWRAERRRILRRFLAGLYQDYVGLTHLARTVARLSPQISRQHELQLLRSQLRFRLLYLLAWLRVTLGIAPVHSVAELTNFVGRLSAQIDAAMMALEQSARSRSGASLNG
jgi:hypothetical protein